MIQKRSIKYLHFICIICFSVFAHLVAAADKPKPLPESAKKQTSQISENEYTRALEAYQRKSYDEALKIAIPIAEKGDSKAQALLGFIYEFGSDNEFRYSQAVEWYEKARLNGNKTGSRNHGFIYQNGYGSVKRDAIKAEKLLLDAGEDKLAYQYLAMLYLQSPEFINEANLQLALQYAKKAVSLGNEGAIKLTTTIECALNEKAPVKISFANPQSIGAYELTGPVKSVIYKANDGFLFDSGYLTFGKSFNLIQARSGNVVRNYYYDSSCNLESEDRYILNKGVFSATRAFQYFDGRLKSIRSSSIYEGDGIANFSYAEQLDGSVFVTQETMVKRGGYSDTSLRYEHRDRLGRVFWNSDNQAHIPIYQPVWFSGPMTWGRGSFIPPEVRQNARGQYSYNRGFQISSSTDGKLMQVINKATSDGQVESVLTYEYGEYGLLKVQRFYEQVRRNEGGSGTSTRKEAKFENYQIDERKNWTSRTQEYEDSGRSVSQTINRQIAYW